MIPVTVSIGDFLYLHVKTNYGTQAQAAKHWGVSPAFVSAVISGKKTPNQQMLDEIGFELVVTFRRIEKP